MGLAESPLPASALPTLSHLVIPIVKYELEEGGVKSAVVQKRLRQRLEEVRSEVAECRGQQCALEVLRIDDLKEG